MSAEKPIPNHEAPHTEHTEREDIPRELVPEGHIWVRQEMLGSGAIGGDMYSVRTLTEGEPIPPLRNRADARREVLLAPGESVGVALTGEWFSEWKNRVLVNEDGHPKLRKPRKVKPTKGWLAGDPQSYSPIKSWK